MEIITIQTGSTLVSSGVPDRSTHRWKKAYSRLFQSKKSRIEVPVKCFYVRVSGHEFLIDAGWSEENVRSPKKHLGFELYFASEPVIEAGDSAKAQLQGKNIDCILMTHLDCDHVSGVHDLTEIPVFCSREEYEYAKKKRLRYGKLIFGIDFKFLNFKYDENAIFKRSADVFGDGSVIAYLTPTHSAGSVIYKISEGGYYYLIVGDNGYMKASWEEGILPGPLYNAKNMLLCLQKIKKMSEDKNCLGVYCAHERDK